MQDAGVMCGLKIKPRLARGSHAGLSPGRPHAPAAGWGCPSPLSCKAASAGGSQGHFLFFSPTNFAPKPFHHPELGRGGG